jgi:hypothetical protein
LKPILLCALILSGCQEYNVQTTPDVENGAVPDILVTPSALSFGPVSSNDSDVQRFSIENVGEASLDLSGIALESGGEAFTVLTPVENVLLDVGEQLEIDVRFDAYVSQNFGRARVFSNDPDTPEAPVDLFGLGEVPELDITPDYHRFPAACDDAIEIKLENIGLEPLVIDDIRYSAPGDLTLVDENALPITLEPSQYTVVDVEYAPSGLGTVVGTVDISSNDPRGVQSAQQEAEPGAGDTVVEEFDVQADPPIDILFAIDKSGSMTEEARHLSDAFLDFVQEIGTATQDWQIGVVTKDGGCFNNGIITPATPNYGTVFRDAATGIQVIQTDLTEALLELSYNALTQTGSGKCNDGFVRYGAVLHMIVISDEPEQSGQPWDSWVALYRANMWDPQMLVISSVVDVFGTCGNGAAGYLEASNDTGGLVLDVCNSNWGVFAADLGQASIAAVQSYALAAQPDPATLEVAVDGVAYPNGWHYDAARNAVVIDVDLPEGAVVTITYETVGC